MAVRGLSAFVSVALADSVSIIRPTERRIHFLSAHNAKVFLNFAIAIGGLALLIAFVRVMAVGG